MELKNLKRERQNISEGKKALWVLMGVYGRNQQEQWIMEDC